MDDLRLLIRPEAFSFPGDVAGLPGFEVFPDLNGDEYGFGLPRGGEYWLRVHRVGSFVLRPDCGEVAGFPDSGVAPESFQEAFFHGVVPWVLQRGHWDCLHAGAVLTPEGVVLFCGPSGRGKSTLARAWAGRGAEPYGDDSVPFRIRDGVAVAARIPQSFRLREPAASHFPSLALAQPAPSEDGEIHFPLAPTIRPIHAIYWMEPMQPSLEAPAVLRRVTPVDALPLLLRAAHCMTMNDPDCNRKMVANYLTLSRIAPVFRLTLVADLNQLPAVLDRLQENQRELACV